MISSAKSALGKSLVFKRRIKVYWLESLACNDALSGTIRCQLIDVEPEASSLYLSLWYGQGQKVTHFGEGEQNNTSNGEQ